ncbi:MAG: preprotein translocase subunit YajC [Eubacteriaceae bacterium]|nr:preprotein translocase subunit YajC [Eubacteriaceae bacterium]
MDNNILMIGLIAFFLISILMNRNSEKKRATQRSGFLDSLKIGDEVTTIGGFFGIVTAVGDDHFILRMIPGEALIKIKKEAIGMLVSAPIVEDEDEDDYEYYDEDDDEYYEDDDDEYEYEDDDGEE